MNMPPPAPNLSQAEQSSDRVPTSASVALAAGLVSIAFLFAPRLFGIFALMVCAVAVVAGLRDTGSWQAKLGLTIGLVMGAMTLLVLAA